MSARAEQLAQKRRDLQLRCALERQQVAHLNANIEARLAIADRVIGVVSNVAKNPLIIIGSIAAAMILGPWRIMKWVSQGAMWFGMARKIQQLVSK